MRNFKYFLAIILDFLVFITNNNKNKQEKRSRTTKTKMKQELCRQMAPHLTDEQNKILECRRLFVLFGSKASRKIANYLKITNQINHNLFTICSWGLTPLHLFHNPQFFSFDYCLYSAVDAQFFVHAIDMAFYCRKF